jgi:hypothetical protein
VTAVTAVICSEVSAPDALLIRWVTNTNKVKPPTQWNSEVKVRFMLTRVTYRAAAQA